MKRIIALLLITVLALTLVSCNNKDTSTDPEKDTPETSDNSDIAEKERELLSIEKIVEDLESENEFQTMIYDKAMSVSQSAKDFNGEVDVEVTYLLNQNRESESWIGIYGLANEEDAKVVEEGRSYLVESRFGDDGYCRRFGSIVVYGNLEIIDELDYSDYNYPESCEPINQAPPSLESVEGIVATIETKGNYGATFYGENTVSQMELSFGKVVDFAQVSELTGNGGWLQVIELETEAAATELENEYSSRFSGDGNGEVLRFGSIIVFGDSPVIAELTGNGGTIEQTPLTVDIVVDAIKASSNLAPQYCDKAARTKHEADFVPRITLHEAVEFYHNGEDKWIVVYRAENEDDAIIAEEGRMWLVDDRYGAEGSCVRYGTIVIYGNMNLISTLDFSSYGLPEETEPKAYELEPSLDSVKGIVATLESSAPLGARYFDERYPALMKNRYQISGEITDMAHLSSVGSSADWIYVYEFSLESDAIAFESARADEVAGYANGGCIRIGNIVVYGDSEFISILK
ncbi:MAG: hypothetical protein IJC50_01640 [Clostridia bacterium]|nr:hypothetical protein [Clostridia bacterium]